MEVVKKPVYLYRKTSKTTAKMETTNKPQEQVILTPTEIEMIRIKREQEELKAKEAETKKQLQREKSIKDISIRREKFVASVTAQQNATEQFLAELNTNVVSHKYEITKTDRKEEFILWDYMADEKDENGYSKRDVYFNETLSYEVFGLNVIGRNIKIEVKEYFKSTGYSSYSRKHVSQGFRMYFQHENKAIKVAKTIIDKVFDKINTEDRNKVIVADKGTAKEMALVELTNRYSEAEITHDSNWVSSGQRGYTTDFYKVKFANGLVVKFTYSLEKAVKENEETFVKINYYGIESYGSIDKINMIEVLKNL